MRLVFATNNLHKLEEVSDILGDKIKLVTPAQLGLSEEIPEEQDTLEGNAIQKARYIYDRLGVNCFADDTGLEVDTLNGRPGVHSARYAGEDKDMLANKQKLLAELQGESNRNAQFRTVIALILDGREYLFEGAVKGLILQEEVGDLGFGYDGLFQPNGYEISFAQMPSEEKNRISHRAIAIAKLSNFLNK